MSGYQITLRELETAGDAAIGLADQLAAVDLPGARQRVPGTGHAAVRTARAC
ncbi:hypothetical protein [Amycolatopsis cihanbeyliensis]|uniref:Uncharacterized protein n=1 Tax=Amycolatopsis cihanbeyliensis TaxID=1128664 RepID=A0A542DMA4_AMYCI|nr:hypothetical protein [Amycolatopsis cihanbeyliensis]TQJ04217.1 hypothetical protein FB471_4000 [Amycolatopsis cihanbeyliensis]